MAATKKPSASKATPKAPKGAAGRSKAISRSAVPLIGRTTEQDAAWSAIARGQFPQGVLLTGAPGVGKQRLALWIGQALLCPTPTAGGPCGVCQSCRLAVGTLHPDLHWFVPHTSVGGGSLDAQVDAVESDRADRLDERRRDALFPGSEAGQGYYVATVHALRRIVWRAPTLGRTKVILLADADRLIAQEGLAGEAANALLKMLEEPPAGTHFLLTGAAPHRIPATIRSRVTTMALAPLTSTAVAKILETACPALAGTPAAAEGARMGDGSVRRATEWLDEEWQAVRAKALEVLRLLLSGDAVARYALVRAQGYGDARGGFSAFLLQIEIVAIQAAEWAATGTAAGLDPRLASLLTEADRRADVSAWIELARAAQCAYREAQGNVNPQLVLHTCLLTGANAIDATARVV
jgi:DNA polymerase-3 subunit delta'